MTRLQWVYHFFLTKETDLDAMDRLAEQLQSYSKVIVGIHGISLGASVKNFGITAEIKFFLKNLIKSQPVIVSVFGNVYSLNEFDNISYAHVCLKKKNALVVHKNVDVLISTE